MKQATPPNKSLNGSQPAPGSKATDVVDRLVALGDPLRLRLLRLLEQEELSVGEIASVVQSPQSTISRRLKLLADTGWLRRRAEGTATYFCLAPDDLSAPSRALWATVREQIGDSPQLDEDRRRLQSVLAARRTDSLSYFGRVSGEWDSIRSDLFGAGFISRALPALLAPDWIIADIGCGTGNAAERLAPYVRSVIAIDQSEPMLAAARKRLAEFTNVQFLPGDAARLPLEDGSIDAVVCVLVLHHLESPEKAIQEMARVLRPGGVACVVDMVEHDRTLYRTAMGHKHLGFTSARIRTMFEQAGFTSCRLTPLRSDPDAKGPGLFVIAGWRPSPPIAASQQHPS